MDPVSNIQQIELIRIRTRNRWFLCDIEIYEF